jgi:hypothetical protein
LFSGSSRAIRGCTAILVALLFPGCSAILGADLGYYEVGAGGSSAGTTTATTSTAAVSSSSSGGSGGSGGGSASSSASSSAASASSSSGTGGAVNDTCWHGAPNDPGGSDACGPSSVAVLADNFTTAIGPLWVAYQIGGTAQVTNQAVEIVIPGPPNKFAGVTSTMAYSLLGCHGSLAVLQSPQHPNTVTHLSFSPDPSSGADLVEVQQVGKSLSFVMVVGGVATDACTIPYLPIAHRYWRIRELGGHLLWETAQDGVAWTIQRREKTPAFVSSVRVDFGVIPIAADLMGKGVFDDFDLP